LGTTDLNTISGPFVISWPEAGNSLCHGVSGNRDMGTWCLRLGQNTYLML